MKESKMIVCPECKGKGTVPLGASIKMMCPTCHGTGKIEETDNGKE